MRSGELSLDVTRVLHGPPERVFAWFAEADRLARWWGPGGFSIPAIDFTPRVGATYRIAMQPPEGEPFALVGTFRDVDPPARLAFSFVWEPPDADDVETVAQLSLAPVDESTEVRLLQGPFKTEARRALHVDGWSESFDRLAELLRAER